MIATRNIMDPIRKALNRMDAAQRAWAAQEPRPESGPVIRADVARALRAIALCDRSADEYLMAFGVGGPNPCRSGPVILPRWGAPVTAFTDEPRGAA